jgi:hypothetical protein
MRGGAQSHLMRGADGHFYVVKFQNNPQHSRILANEWLATRLAGYIGLPVPVAEIVEVSDWLIQESPELHVQLASKKVPCSYGLQFGSRFIVDPREGHVLEYMPDSFLLGDAGGVRNPDVFAGALAFDKWCCNTDSRQIIYWKRTRERKYTAALVDQGHCFNAGDWNFPDSPLRGIFSSNAVYSGVIGWDSFEPSLSRIETLDANVLWELAKYLPSEWYEHDTDAFRQLVESLVHRRPRVRELIESFRFSSRNPFPNWKNEKSRPFLASR